MAMRLYNSKNGISISITDEDVEEIISDVFVAIWKNSTNLLKTTKIKPYLTGISKKCYKEISIEIQN